MCEDITLHCMYYVILFDMSTVHLKVFVLVLDIFKFDDLLRFLALLLLGTETQKCQLEGSCPEVTTVNL